jgi:hypothetical protein
MEPHTIDVPLESPPRDVPLESGSSVDGVSALQECLHSTPDKVAHAKGVSCTTLTKVSSC